MGWIYLLFAGLFEVGFTSMLKLSDNFTKLYPSIGFFFFSILSFYLLTKAVETIPIGTAYAIWTGIGAAGTVLIGIFFFQESAGFWRMFFITILIMSIIGLKLVSVTK
ncbi:MAG: QacE family quaternary ammonium compound efflux SMR transporter [Ignavibacteriales bacterium CG18_big_fil_WC_8_21_14_2_50_31_20]|nr:MAG: QacE family quaternary ammonium compound efflux SMR transporter [Ignavibacteriales bacterium CG18_big_fil_WC_8_21_14_2_50_31_20]